MSRAALAATKKRADVALVSPPSVMDAFAHRRSTLRGRAAVDYAADAGAAVSRQAITKHLHALEEAGLARVLELAGNPSGAAHARLCPVCNGTWIRYRGSGTRRSIDSAPWWKNEGSSL